MPFVFLLQGSVVTQNEHVEPQRTGDSYNKFNTGCAPSGASDFPDPAVPQTGRWVVKV